jgi:hypothetical protein
VGKAGVKYDQEPEIAEEPEAGNNSLLESGAIRVALLFGSAAVAFALILTPFVDRGAGSVVAARGVAAQLDQIATGSTASQGDYTVRRSVLQSSPQSVCVIRANGRRSGAC